MMLRRLAPTLLLAAALLVPAAAVAQDRTVTVNGSATQQVANDSAGLGFSVSKERRARGAALRAMAQRLRAVIAAVQTVPGVGPGDVTTGTISVRKVTVGEHVLYRASEGIRVILHQPDKAGELVDVAIQAGATGTSGPRFFVGNSAPAYNAALLTAFDQAKERAAALATRAGATLGPVVSIEEGGSVDTPVFSSPKSAAECTQIATPRVATSPCAPPVKPGTSTVTATVRVVFALQ